MQKKKTRWNGQTISSHNLDDMSDLLGTVYTSLAGSSNASARPTIAPAALLARAAPPGARARARGGVLEMCSAAVCTAPARGGPPPRRRASRRLVARDDVMQSLNILFTYSGGGARE